jgi:predicted dehydrogenase
MRFFVGDIDWMFAHVTSQGHDITSSDVKEGTEPVGLVTGDCINSYFAFKNGVSGFFDSRKDQVGSDNRYGMDIVGSQGMISLRGGTASNVAIYSYPLWSPNNASQKWEPLKLDDTSLATGNQLAIIDLIDAVENDRKPISSGSDAISALEMILGAYESQITGGRVKFPMKNRKHPLVQMLNSRQ